MALDPLREALAQPAGFHAPRFKQDAVFPSGIRLFTTPMLAVIPADSNGPIEAVEITNYDPNRPMALPLSIVWTGLINCTAVDLTGEGTIDLEDFAVLAQHWLEGIQ